MTRYRPSRCPPIVRSPIAVRRQPIASANRRRPNPLGPCVAALPTSRSPGPGRQGPQPTRDHHPVALKGWNIADPVGPASRPPMHEHKRFALSPDPPHHLALTAWGGDARRPITDFRIGCSGRRPVRRAKAELRIVHFLKPSIPGSSCTPNVLSAMETRLYCPTANTRSSICCSL